MTAVKESRVEETNVEPGEFPFPLSDGPEESRYLTWVRNHSNYMAVRGFLDYLRMAAVLLRGILINCLTLLPYLLVAALVLSLAYGNLLEDWHSHAEGQKFFLTKAATEAGWVATLQEYLWQAPFLFTPLAVALALGWVLLFPFIIRLTKVASHKRSLETGSVSSVKMRDVFERSFGAALLIIGLLAVLESLPLMVHYYHHYSSLSAPQMSITFAGVMVVLSAANKILSSLGGLKKKLAMLLIGLLGLLIPLMVVLYVTEFLVYDEPYEGALYAGLVILTGLFVAGLLAAMTLGLVKGTFKLSEYPRLLGLLGLVLLFAALVIVAFAADENQNRWFVVAWAAGIWLFAWLAVDVNLTSVHGLYRDRLASAYLVGKDTSGEVDIEQDIDLGEICRHEAGSKAPYHIVNVALNLQGSQDMAIRERNSDFFIFSKRFIGGNRTGYCRSGTMEEVYPQLDLPSAMAISAAAASPNMGRGTDPLLVAFMTLLNVRLGVWTPNPGLLEQRQVDPRWKRKQKEALAVDKPGFRFEEVFAAELVEVERRWEQAYAKRVLARKLAGPRRPTTAHGLVGIGFSGGGIRSATINMGIAQALHAAGVFDHLDYMSTVSGGGYLGSSISTLMRRKTSLASEVKGTVEIKKAAGTVVRVTGTDPDDVATYAYSKHAELEHSIQPGAQIEAGRRIIRRSGPRARSEITGVVSVEVKETGEKVVRIKGDKSREYRYSRYDTLAVKDGAEVEAGAPLIERYNSLLNQFRWRVRPWALVREIMSKLDETSDWVNLSDGGHIENLAGIELLRRKCKYIIIGDGEADPNHHFNGLATLMRYASIDLGIDIEIDVEDLRLTPEDDGELRSQSHWAVGTIHYPGAEEPGRLLYMKSSVTGDEDEVVVEYRHRNPAFPHESTADQFFDEGQFEAYRALGQHIGENALEEATATRKDGKLSYADLEKWFKKLGSAT